MTRDPVCGMEVEEASAAAEVEYRGIRYYFCSEDCKEAFERYPENYVQEDRPGASP